MTQVWLAAFSRLLTLILDAAIAEGHGDAALVLLKAGAETDKRDVDGKLAIDLAPDNKVRKPARASDCNKLTTSRSGSL